jgi:hypothetical protein
LVAATHACTDARVLSLPLLYNRLILGKVAEAGAIQMKRREWHGCPSAAASGG